MLSGEHFQQLNTSILHRLRLLMDSTASTPLLNNNRKKPNHSFSIPLNKRLRCGPGC